MPGRTPSCLGVAPAWLSNIARPVARETLGTSTRCTARPTSGVAPAMPMSPCQSSLIVFDADEPSFSEDSDKEIVAKVTAQVDVGISSLDQFQATHQLDSAVGQIKESAQAALPANDSTLFAAVPTADASSPAVKEPAQQLWWQQPGGPGSCSTPLCSCLS